MDIKNCCYHCPRRTATCHIDCPDNAEREKRQADERKAKELIRLSMPIPNQRFIFGCKKRNKNQHNGEGNANF